MSGSVPCPSCGKPVPPGALSCPSCGSLLAAVRHDAPAFDRDDVLARDVDPGDPEHAEHAGHAAPAADAEPAPDLAAFAAGAETDLEPERSMEPEVSMFEAEPAPASSGLASGGIVPGAYLPPSTVQRSAPVTPSSQPVPTPRPWTAPAPPPPQASPSPSVAEAAPPVLSAASAAATPAARAPQPGKASILSDLPFDAPDELEGWLITLGAGLAIIGFILPWHEAFEFGIAGYFGSWGLGIGSNLPIFGLIVVILALSILPNRVSQWVRYGVLGMVGGGVLFGVTWLYIGGGTEIGTLLAAVGGVLLIAGGILAVAPGRGVRRAEDV